MPELDRIINLIWKRAEELGIDLESMGIYDAEDLQLFAVRFMLANIEDLDDFMFDTLEDDEILSEEGA